MPTHAESNACNACAGSKRKCGRQKPSCTRCAHRGKSCVYPPLRSKAASSSRPLWPDTLRDSVPRVEDGLHAGVADNTSSLLPDELMLDLAFSLTDSDFAASPFLTQTPSTPATRADWFLAPETWNITRRVTTSIDTAVGKATMKQYVAVLQSWFERWVTTGTNPFIHSQLYRANFPACVQVAYATLASYIHRTPATTDTILQIIEDRSNDLLQENGAILDMLGAEEWADREEQDVDLFAQLTRLHALMVYQIIGLFDGDIRSRRVAEGHMAVQDSWAGKLFHSAAKTLSDTHAAATHLVGCLPKPFTFSQQQWYLWLLSESIRRTWLVAVSITAVFSALQRGWSTCPGGVMYTNRSGLWNAASATVWEKQCLGKNTAFLQRFECAKLFDEAAPADIDEFGMAMLDMTFNRELLEKWRARDGGCQSQSPRPASPL
ncbi:uncharacterized protein N7459_008867 [Penicillium hispanicum]|uniref:uncharacterized protein n=1 Tax=Penicillium hispanicum TaxID=1080232 RepID=UPI00253FAD5B|nr:uncharacterized protein N7459_008867 [Penicillium hispanicum]KAJ5569437.1 hypothetical protein N7459_008867 [Penicillium hispanicum]